MKELIDAALYTDGGRCKKRRSGSNAAPPSITHNPWNFLIWPDPDLHRISVQPPSSCFAGKPPFAAANVPFHCQPPLADRRLVLWGIWVPRAPHPDTGIFRGARQTISSSGFTGNISQVPPTAFSVMSHRPQLGKTLPQSLVRMESPKVMEAHPDSWGQGQLLWCVEVTDQRRSSVTWKCRGCVLCKQPTVSTTLGLQPSCHVEHVGHVVSGCRERTVCQWRDEVATTQPLPSQRVASVRRGCPEL